MPEEIRNRISLLDSEIYYEIYGEGIPVLMIHGWSVDHRLMSGCLEPVFTLHPTQFMRIYIDLPGMGLSKAGESIRCSDQVLDVILAFVDAVIPGKKFILAGESYGGLLSRGLLRKRREEILGLLLICPSVTPDQSKRNVPPFTVMKKDAEFLSRLSFTERAAFTWINVVQTQRVWDKFRTDIYPAIKLYDRAFLDHRLEGAFSYEVDPLEKPFEEPCLILTGRQDSSVGYKDQFTLLEDYPHASFVILDRAGHNLQIEQEDLFNNLVSEWLDRVVEKMQD
ncbi:MAG: alpha/beta hydrolase [Eubacteriales bacterium]